MAYVLTKDIVIPAGTVLGFGPAKTVYADIDGNPAGAKPAHWVEAIIGHGADASSHWRIHIDDAVTGGIIKIAED